MARGINRCIFIGNMTRDIEVRSTTNGKTVGNASIAINSTWGGKEETEFVDLVFWGKLAEIVKEHTSKGSTIYVEGRMHTKQYEVDGQKRRSTQINVDELVFLGGKSESKGDVPF